VQRRFVILCLGRSGSTHLQSLLDSHSRIRCFGELFNRTGRGTRDYAEAPEPDPASYLARVYAGCEEPVVGFKLPVNSIRDHPEVVEMIAAEPETMIIRLSRRNLLAQLVSRRLQSTTLVSHSIYGDYGGAKVALEPTKAIHTMEGMEAHERELDGYAAGHPTFRIAYEDLGEEAELERLQRFLGVPTESLSSWFEKLRTAPLSETVENWGELAAALTGTRFEPLLTIES
jgi:hypothetical protein